MPPGVGLSVPADHATHTIACNYEAFEPEEARRIDKRIEWHFKPDHGSWLNMVEIELSVIYRQYIRRRIPVEARLVSEIAAREQARNAEPVKIDYHIVRQSRQPKEMRAFLLKAGQHNSPREEQTRGYHSISWQCREPTRVRAILPQAAYSKFCARKQETRGLLSH